MNRMVEIVAPTAWNREKPHSKIMKTEFTHFENYLIPEHPAWVVDIYGFDNGEMFVDKEG